MKTLKEFLFEQPTNSVGSNGYQRDATASGPVAGDDKKLFKGSDDLVTQDYQTPAEPGLAKWRFSNVYPVLKLAMNNSRGDGPSIDDMVAASKMFVDRMDNPQERVRKTFEQFQEEWSNKYKKSIDCSNPKGFSQKAHCAGRKKRAK
jgi:hypothetical protein